MPEYAVATSRPWWVRLAIGSRSRPRKYYVAKCWLAVPISMLTWVATIGGFWWYYPQARDVHDLGFWVGMSCSLGLFSFCLLYLGLLMVWTLLAIHWVDRNDSWPEQG